MLYGDIKKPTKERILDAAFSLFTQPRFKDISLSEVAAQVGISKTAIFRHFENKESLIDAMNVLVFDELTEIVHQAYLTIVDDPDISNRQWKLAIESSITYLIKNKPYLFYLFFRFTNTKDPDVMLYQEFIKRNIYLYEKTDVTLSDDGTHLVIHNADGFVRMLFIISSIIFFITDALKANMPFESEEQIKQFSAFVSQVLATGVCKKTEYLSDEQLSAFDDTTLFDKAALPPEDPVLIAVGTVTKEHGMTGTTVELIAKQLGLAKSSLYTYFKNKEEMFTKVIQKELTYLTQALSIIEEKSLSTAQSNYLLLKSLVDFFALRPSLIPSMGWLTISGTLIPEESVCKDLNIDTSQFNNPMKGLRFKQITVGTYYDWMGMISSSLFIHMLKYDFTKEQTTELVKHIFMYIQRGVRWQENTGAITSED